MSRPLRAALYARVSTTGHGQDAGLQLDELRQVAAQRGWEAVAYVDEGVSGAKDSRPALDRMLVDAREGRLDVVAIWKLDRLARSVRNLLELVDSLNAWGVGLVSLRDAHIDTTTPSGRFTLQILAAVAELERELVRERVIAGVRRAQAAGKHCGRPGRAGPAARVGDARAGPRAEDDVEGARGVARDAAAEAGGRGGVAAPRRGGPEVGRRRGRVAGSTSRAGWAGQKQVVLANEVPLPFRSSQEPLTL